jgi:DnaJ-class molecular chaperone
MGNYSINYFEILGLQPNATMQEIKAAYRRLAQKWHPDHHQGESASDIAYAEQMFRLITKAYQVLMGSAEAEQQDPAGNAGSEAAQGESSSEGSHANTFMTILKYVAILAVVAFVLWLVVKILNFIVSVLIGIAIIALIIFVVMHVV